MRRYRPARRASDGLSAAAPLSFRPHFAPDFRATRRSMFPRVPDVASQLGIARQAQVPTTPARQPVEQAITRRGIVRRLVTSVEPPLADGIAAMRKWSARCQRLCRTPTGHVTSEAGRGFHRFRGEGRKALHLRWYVLLGPGPGRVLHRASAAPRIGRHPLRGVGRPGRLVGLIARAAVLADQTRGYRVVVTVDFDVIVGGDPAFLLFGILIGFAR